ncbi:hypothetical protein [Photobacterium damselae]|uniref:hypothetical protein n=1 Tax=Photobacterium damselae TaxID=38293 RepID=UPI0010FE611D|nr:hypothetical protein [Photobacterium damselae]TLS69318.1 hypothetical protein FD718_12865 [Photobacterium damselae subsp. damselae]
MRREEMKNVIEPFIYKSLQKEEYNIKNIDSRDLLTWNRFDLAFKLIYLDTVNKHPKLANEIYKYDIKAQTLGTFKELGNEDNKNRFEHYIEQFNYTYNEIKDNGFLKEKTLIPLSIDGTIINGAHRVASAIHLDKPVSCIVTEQSTMVANYEYFIDRGIPIKYLDNAAKKFIEYSNNNIYMAFLWPSGKGDKKEVENIFSNIVYKKTITLTPKGSFNLLYELYNHMDWIGTKKNGFSGIKQKLVECFPSFESFQVILFQSESLEKVQELKKKVRDIHNIGYSSIHITDTKEEAIKISDFIFNDNGLHFINNAETNKYIQLKNKLDEFKCFLNKNNIETKDVVIDGSTTLSLYGLRDNIDIDFLTLDNSKIIFPNIEFDTHDSELQYHRKSKEELIYDDSNYYIYNGLKFISFSQLYTMKSNRNEEKDINDCLMMKSLLEGDLYKKSKAQIKQKFFYFKIKSRRIFMDLSMKILKIVGIYKPVRTIYRKLKACK